MSRIRITKSVPLVLLVLFLAISLVVFYSCNKDEDDNNNNGTSFAFTSLVAEHDTIMLDGSTLITATATGSGLTYTWSVAKGNIVGSGSQITYAATPCCVGNNELSCTVEDGDNNTLTRYVTVTVIY